MAKTALPQPWVAGELIRLHNHHALSAIHTQPYWRFTIRVFAAQSRYSFSMRSVPLSSGFKKILEWEQR